MVVLPYLVELGFRVQGKENLFKRLKLVWGVLMVVLMVAVGQTNKPGDITREKREWGMFFFFFI